jgi:hypothetical protein
MPRVIGPLMSLSASQTLGDTLVFSQWKGRYYVRLRVTPYNPKSDYQTGIRRTLTFGVLYFTKGSYVSASAKVWWNTYGEAEKPPVSGFNRFMRQFIALNYDDATGTFIYKGIPNPS